MIKDRFEDRIKILLFKHNFTILRNLKSLKDEYSRVFYDVYLPDHFIIVICFVFRVRRPVRRPALCASVYAHSDNATLYSPMLLSEHKIFFNFSFSHRPNFFR